MNYNKKLGIAIPVYRRPKLLSICLASAIASCKKYSIPIFISDDSCSDINIACIKQAKSEYPYIFHTINSSNLGIDGNILKSVNDCPCDYVWLIGEDDKFCPSAIDVLLPVISEAEYPFIFVNYSYISNDYLEIIRDRRIEVFVSKTVNANQFVSEYLWAIGFIGACVINKSEWNKVSSDKYVGTYFAHVGVIAEVIWNKYVRMIEIPLVLNRAEDVSSTSWSAVSFDVNFGWDHLLNLLTNIYNSDCIDIAFKNSKAIFWHRSLLFLISKRADNIYDYSKYEQYILKGEFSSTFKFFAYAIVLFPVLPFNHLKKMYKLIKNIKKLI